jgi:hypothetical protein
MAFPDAVHRKYTPAAPKNPESGAAGLFLLVNQQLKAWWTGLEEFLPTMIVGIRRKSAILSPFV